MTLDTASPTPTPPPALSQALCEVCWRRLPESEVRAEVCPSCGQAAPAGGFHALPLGFKSRYRLIDQLGRGGQGAVFLAHDEASPDEQGKPLEVALKVARLDLAIDLRHRLLERFRREMSATMRLSTEVRGEENRRHFVRCLASDLGRSPYLVLELVTWPTLRQLLERSPGERFGSYDEVVDFGIELLLGVATMHEHRMVHRDLKPENLFVRLEQGRFSIKIADFGVWTDPPVQEGGHGGSLTHDLVGTPEYMSPEQQMSGAVGARSDLHAVGSILWLTATGVKPFGWDRSAPSFQDAFLRRVEALKVPPPRPAEMPEDLYAALVHALAYDVEQRYTDARAFVRALRELKRSWNNSKVEAFRVLRDELDALAEQIDHAATRVRAVTETGEALAVLARDVAEARIQSAATSMEFPQLRERVESLRVDAARLTRALDGLFQAESNATARTLAAGSDSLPEKPSATPTPPPVQTLTPETPPPRSGARVTLLGVGSGAVTAGGLFLLLRLYGTPAAAPTAPPEPHVAPPPAARTEPATPSLDDPALNPWQPVPEQPFVMHQHEVTRAEYARWLDTPEQHARRVPWIIGDAETRPHPSVLTSLAADERLLPVVDIDHEEASAYCRALRARLPTTWEWQLAFSPDAWGDAAVFTPAERPQPVDDPTLDVTPSGLRGMLGNVMEWLYAPEGAALAHHTSAAFDLPGNARLQLAASPTQEPTQRRAAALGFRCLRPLP